jgi:hypothetical protein
MDIISSGVMNVFRAFVDQDDKQIVLLLPGKIRKPIEIKERAIYYKESDWKNTTIPLRAYPSLSFDRKHEALKLWDQNQEEILKEYMPRWDVMGVSVGQRCFLGDIIKDELCIIIYVLTKYHWPKDLSSLPERTKCKTLIDIRQGCFVSNNHDLKQVSKLETYLPKSDSIGPLQAGKKCLYDDLFEAKQEWPIHVKLLCEGDFCFIDKRTLAFLALLGQDTTISSYYFRQITNCLVMIKNPYFHTFTKDDDYKLRTCDGTVIGEIIGTLGECFFFSGLYVYSFYMDIGDNKWICK